MARVLVVENRPDTAEVIRRLLETLEHEVVLEEDGFAAYERLVAEEEDFDLLMVDLHMPGMPGKALIERAEWLLQDVTPVIAMSGSSYYLDALGPLQQRLAAVMRKPQDFKVQSFREHVARALEVRARWVASRPRQDPSERWRRKARVLAHQNLDLLREARHDPMTGLPTRRALMDDFEWLATTRCEHGGAVVLALMDIDGFRRFNRELGYQGGDAVIQHVARCLAGALREWDTLYRYGGDEFVLLLQAQDLAEGVRAVRRLQGCVAKAPAPVVGGRSLGPLTFSAGLDLYPADRGPTVARMLEVANVHLRAAKAAGGTTIRPVVDGGTGRLHGDSCGDAMPLRDDSRRTA